jgi:hypothetical protein
VRTDGRVDNDPTVQAQDVHAVIEALALVAAHPGDVTTLVAHAAPRTTARATTRCPPTGPRR